MNYFDDDMGAIIADLEGCVNNFKATSISFNDVLYEAITNSIQANASNIDVELITLQDNIEEDVKWINEVKITDNGDGFCESNRNSFANLYSKHKKHLGCKGVGRLCFLKVFTKTKITSDVKSESKLYTLDFDLSFDSKKTIFAKKETNHTKQTILEFCGIHERFKQKYEEKTLGSIKDKILLHLMPILFFRKQNNSCLSINIICNDKTEKIDLNKLPDFKYIEYQNTKNNEKYDFKLFYNLEKRQNGKLLAYYCANDRGVVTFSSKKFKITIPQNWNAIFFLTSKYFDSRVNQDRGDFDVRFSDTENELYNDLSWNDINNALENEVLEILRDSIKNFAEHNTEVLNQLKTELPSLVKYIQKDRVGFLSKKDTINRCYDALKKDRYELEKLIKNTKSGSDTLISKTQDMMESDLLQYVRDRQIIIDNLKKMSNNKEKYEKNIHNLIMKKGTVGTSYSPLKIRDNNIWLLDDKFMSYKYVASEVTLNNILKNIKQDDVDIKHGNNRCDIAIYTTTDNGKKRVVLIELKNFSAGDYENSKGINQLSKYGRALKDNGVDEIYCYLIAEFKNNDLSQQLEDTYNFTKLYSTEEDEEMWHGCFTKIPVYVQVISPQALIADANTRNGILLDVASEYD